jgi:crotonobetainyl-CoA:carnitine CoA-transferase CaiB-like acyl-CoA transferase
VRRRAPLLGEHSAEVLDESGFSAGEVATLREAGVIS